MSYSHSFFAVDLEQIQALYGSGNSKPIAKLITHRPKLRPFLESIVSGEIDANADPAGYGYALKELCESLGEQIGDEVADVRDHPYDSKLASSGPPLPIPYDPSDFPQIGFLRVSEIEEEINRIDAAPAITGKRKIPGRRRGPAAQMAGAIADDVSSYRETLEEALQMGLAIVSFRH